MTEAEHNSLDGLKARRLDAMSAAERAEFDEDYDAARRRIESVERREDHRFE